MVFSICMGYFLNMKFSHNCFFYLSVISFLIGFILFVYFNFPILYEYNHISIDKRYLYIPIYQEVTFNYLHGLWLSPIGFGVMSLLAYLDFFTLMNKLEIKKNFKKHIKEGVVLFRLYRSKDKI